MSNYSLSGEVSPTPAKTPKKAIVAAATGNALEWYDFGVYVYIATTMAAVFYPAHSHELLLAFGTFGVGYLVRPLGSIVIGHVGDRVGRRAALSITVIGMGAATFLVGVLPTYAAVGIAAPILLTILRLVQGFAAGGEWGGSAVFMVEHARPERRGFVGSWQQFTVALGFLMGSGMSALLTNTLSSAQMASFGWRIPFLVGIVLGAVGLYTRLRVDETPEFRALESAGGVERAPLAKLRLHIPGMLRVVGFTAMWSVMFTFTLNYTPTYLQQIGFDASFSLIVATIVNSFVCALIPFMGLLSDSIGRRGFVLGVAVVIALAAYPLFWVLQSAGTSGAIIIVLSLGLLLSVISGCGPAFLAGLFPTNVRYAALSVPYNIAAAVFAGFTPFIVTLLITTTGSNLAVTYYVIGASIVGFVAVLSARKRRIERAVQLPPAEPSVT